MTGLIRFWLALAAVVCTASVAWAQRGRSLDDLLPEATPPIAAPSESEADSRPEVVVEAKVDRTRIARGEVIVVAVIFDHAEGWHSWPSMTQDVLPPEIEEFAERTDVSVVDLPDWLRVAGPVQWPDLHLAPVPDLSDGIGTVDVLTYSGRAVAFIPLRVGEGAPAGLKTLNVLAEYQSCNDTSCLMPESVEQAVEFEVVLDPAQSSVPIRDGDFSTLMEQTISSDGVVPAPTDQADSEGLGAADAEETTCFDFFGAKICLSNSAYLLVFPISFIAGFILNFTPCVLPVIPLKIMSIQQHAQEPAKLILYGTVYCLGIISMFAVLAVLVLLFGQAWGQLNSFWWFAVPMALIVFALGLGMMDLYTIRLPQKVYMFSPSGDSVPGNFGLGVLTAILSTPCTGPLLGGAIVWASSQPTFVGVSGVLTMGIGMAFPYALLMLFPGMLKKLPKAGPGSRLLKEVIGIFMLAVGVYILSFLTTETWTWWFVGLFTAAAFIWLYIGGLIHLKTTNGKIIATHFSLLGLIVTWWMTAAMTGFRATQGGQIAGSAAEIEWIVFKGNEDGDLSATIDQSLEAGKVVVVDFTAKWCVNCHVIEKRVFNSPAGITLLNSEHVVAIKVDITSNAHSQGFVVLEELSGAASIPFVAIMGPAVPRDSAITFSSFFPVDSLLDSVGVAQGQPLVINAGSG